MFFEFKFWIFNEAKCRIGNIHFSFSEFINHYKMVLIPMYNTGLWRFQ